MSDGDTSYCRGCKQEKSKVMFLSVGDTGTTRKSRCVSCRRQYARDYHAAHYLERKDEILARGRRSYLKSNYGITEETLDFMSRSQDGICPICESELGDRRVIDHNHETGQIRGLLCRPCNGALGIFKESIEVLDRARQYLELDGIASTYGINLKVPT